MLPNKLPCIDEIDLKGKRVLIRADLGGLMIPTGAEIAGSHLESPLESLLGTIKYARDESAGVIIAAHLDKRERKRGPKGFVSLDDIGLKLAELLDCSILFPENSYSDVVVKLSREMLPGSVMLLENLFRDSGEMDNSEEFAKKITSLAEVFVNDAFSLSGRELATIAKGPKFADIACIGLNFRKEVDALEKLLGPNEGPFAAVLGGYDVGYGLGLMESLIDRVDTCLLGGGIANLFLKALNHDLGATPIDKSLLFRAKGLISSAMARDIRLIMPSDFVVVRPRRRPFEAKMGFVPSDGQIVDIGPDTIDDYVRRLGLSGRILISGPIGMCGSKKDWDYCEGSSRIFQTASSSDAFTFVLGEDTLDSISKCQFSGTISHLTTCSDAVLKYIQGRPLPGIEAFKSVSS